MDSLRRRCWSSRHRCSSLLERRIQVDESKRGGDARVGRGCSFCHRKILMNSRPFILALLVINVLVNWACTFSPQPKSGLQSCDPSDRSCPFGYVCAADNKCWRSEDLVNAADASGVTNASGAAGGGGRGSGGANQGASSAIGNGGAVAPSGGAGGRGGSSGSAGASGSCTQPTAAETGRASMCLNGLAVHLVCAGTIPGTTRPPCCGLEYPYY